MHGGMLLPPLGEEGEHKVCFIWQGKHELPLKGCKYSEFSEKHGPVLHATGPNFSPQKKANARVRSEQVEGTPSRVRAGRGNPLQPQSR